MGTSILAATTAEGGETLRELPIPPVGFGLLALAALGLLLVVTFAFRSVASRH